MSTQSLQKILKAGVLMLFGFFNLILLIRLLLKLIGASEESSFVRLWYQVSDPLYSPFAGTMGDLKAENITFEISSLIAIIIFSILIFYFLRLISIAFKPKIQDKLRGLLDFAFKTFELILILRIIFRLIGAHISPFVNLLYALSSPVYQPFKDILKPIMADQLVFETSTLIAIIILLIMDYFTDRIFTEISKENVETYGESGYDAPAINSSGNFTSPPPVPPQQSPSMQQAPTINVNYTSPNTYVPQQQIPQQNFGTQQGGEVAPAPIPSSQPSTGGPINYYPNYSDQPQQSSTGSMGTPQQPSFHNDQPAQISPVEPPNSQSN